MTSDKRRKKVKRLKKIRRGTLTLSLPDDLIKYLRGRKGYSGYVASLIRADIKKEATAKPVLMSPEEAEIRQALKERERLVELYGDKVYDVELVISKMEAFDEGQMIIVEDWEIFMREKDIEDKRGYFKLYEKYRGLKSLPKFSDLWFNVKEQVGKEQDQLKELDLQREVAMGMTKQEILDKLEVYLERRLNEKVEKYKAEIEALRESAKDASDFMIIKQRNKIVSELRERFERREVTMKQIVDALGLPYMVVYNKIAPILIREGYKIVK